jgi:hypothetical protein
MIVRRFIMRILRRKTHPTFAAFEPFGSTRSIAPHFAELCGRLERRTSQVMAERGLRAENPQIGKPAPGLLFTISGS